MERSTRGGGSVIMAKNKMEVTNEELLKRIELMDSRVSTKFESNDRWRAVTTSQLEKANKTLYGNGEAGMDERIRNIERIMSSLLRLAWVATTAIVGSASVYFWEQLIK
jgi:hypothetical protein